MTPARFDRHGIAAFLLGTFALVALAGFYPAALLLGGVGMALGVSSVQRTRGLRKAKGRSLAYWGFASGAIAFVVALILAAVAAVITDDPRIREVIQSELERQAQQDG